MRTNPLSDPMFHVVLAWGIIFLICLASPANGKSWPTHDRWGNKYPEECRRDLTHVQVRVSFEPLGYIAGKKTLGYFMPSMRGQKSAPPTVYVDSSIRDMSIQDEVLHHELCHAQMWYLTGNLHWH